MSDYREVIAQLAGTNAESEAMEEAERLDRALQATASDTNIKKWLEGEVLYFMQTDKLWRFFAESYKEYFENRGLSAGTEFLRRKNFEFYVLQLGLDPKTDDRLKIGNESKLGLATRKAFRPWVSENIDEFLDMATLPLDQGGLSRADLRKTLEENVGLDSKAQSSLLTGALSGLRKAVMLANEMGEEDWLELADALRHDDDLYAPLARLIKVAGEIRPRHTIVEDEVVGDIELEEAVDEG